MGRVVAIKNDSHIDFHEEQVGFFGFFESVEDSDNFYVSHKGLCKMAESDDGVPHGRREFFREAFTKIVQPVAEYLDVHRLGNISLPSKLCCDHRGHSRKHCFWKPVYDVETVLIAVLQTPSNLRSPTSLN